MWPQKYGQFDIPTKPLENESIEDDGGIIPEAS
jgi:hypothetical protein